ncbi:hypothetical protein KUCAC02_004335 [Chaenocephalus aceratus]|uniref:Uncharacterized protein n=1 Tax=Chaenocephalus aceratus TaxID=36190 RepID=A0ACB9X025_CHAAC|nr:hypothetical protein KUCAC02_004335 [Chaenocephalus aceratus]
MQTCTMVSAIKGRGAKVRTVKQHESKKGSSNENTDSPNLSAIDRASFLEGLQLNYGNPLHSTALEEDLNVEEQTSAARPEKNQLVKKGKKRKSGMSCDPEPQEQSDSGGAQQRRKRVLSSEEEDGGEERSWCPSPKTARQWHLLNQRRPALINRGRGKGGPGGTQLEVVLEAFLDFCDQYRESLESNTLKRLLEKISTSKELKGERQVCLLQKEKSELKARLADLRRGQAFLHDIRELNTQYLDYRHKHPKEKEMYGASSLPALLLEAKSIQAEELQPKGNNEEEQNSEIMHYTPHTDIS